MSSSYNSDFNFDYNVSFTYEELVRKRFTISLNKIRIVLSVKESAYFIKILLVTYFHTYSTYACSIDILKVTYQYLDLVLKGRDEDGLNFLNFACADMMSIINNVGIDR